MWRVAMCVATTKHELFRYGQTPVPISFIIISFIRKYPIILQKQLFL